MLKYYNLTGPRVYSARRWPRRRYAVHTCIISSSSYPRIFISVIKHLDAQKFCFKISLFHASTCFEHMCSSSGGLNCITQPLVSSHLWVAVSCTRRNPMCTGRPPTECDDTRNCVMQFWPPDDDHMCSKHVEAWNKLIVKQKVCASVWLITEIHKLRCTVSKTPKYPHMLLVTTPRRVEATAGPICGNVV